MEKRYTFECWHCKETYTLLRDTRALDKIFVACPYCSSEAEVDLSPYPKKVVSVMLGDGKQPSQEEILDLPDVLPTQEKSEEDADA